MLRTAAQIQQRFDEVKSKRLTFERTYQDIADEELGLRDITVRTTPGRQRMLRIYDTTALQSGTMLAGGLQGLLMNPAAKWFHLRVGDGLDEIPDVAFWIEDTEARMLDAFHSPKANFVPQMAETVLDVVMFGMGTNFVSEAFLPEQRGVGPHFSSRPIGEIFVLENQQGRVDTVFREFRMTARQIEQEWPGRSQAAGRAVKSTGADEEMEMLHLVHPNPDPTQPLIGTRQPWRSVYVSVQDKAIIAEGGFRKMPYLVARWMKESGEVYGRGPGWTALSDAKMLNQMAKALIQLAQLSTRPPLMVPNDGVIRQVSMGPNSVNVVAADLLARGVAPIQPLQVGANFPITKDVLQSYQQQVRDAFHADLFQLFKDPRMTATQVLELVAQVQRHLAPVLGRLQVELLDPMVERVFDILAQARRLRPAPPVLRGRRLQVEYVSPVMRAQAVTEARSTLELWNAAKIIGEVDPAVFDNLDADESIRVIHAAQQAPLRVLRRREAVGDLRVAQAEAQAAKENVEQAATLSKGVAPLLQAVNQAEAA